jgi:glycosyltransferase involved in cell wall biosynthesis
MQPFAIIALVLILAQLVTELWLSGLNQRHVRDHAKEIPPAFRGIIDEATYGRSVDYTLVKGRFGDIVNVFDAVVLIALLFSGLLPWAFGNFSGSVGTSTLAMAGFLFVAAIALTMLGLPFSWYAQFKLEERFGFNTTTMKTWILDRIKGFLLAVLLGYPLLVLVLKLIDWTGANWWLWAAAVVIAFQSLLLLVAPNKPKRSREEVRRDLGVNDKFLVLHMSNLRPVKRIDLLLRTIAMSKDRARLRLLILAGGPFDPYEPLLQELGLRDTVIVRQNTATVEEYLEAADAGLYTSEYESFGLGILETVFYGKPIVAFRVGGIPEVIGDSCPLYPFGDVGAAAAALNALVESPVLARQLGEQSRARVIDRFSADRVVPRYEALYRRIVGA